AAGHVDDVPEDEREQKDEHDRLERHVEELLGDLAHVPQVASGERQAVGHEPPRALSGAGRGGGGEGGHQAATPVGRRDGGAGGAGGPEGRARKPWSSVAGRRWTWSAATSAASSARTMSTSGVPGRTGTVATSPAESLEAGPSANAASADSASVRSSS